MIRKYGLLGLGAIGAAVLALSVWATDPGPDDLNEGSRLEWDDVNEIWRYKWYAKENHTYFVQVSDTDMQSWAWIPTVVTGPGVREYGFTTTAPRFFVRLRYIDAVTEDPENGDLDGDGVSTLVEIQNGLNPMRAEDNDLDGLPDDWEAIHAGTFAVYPPVLAASLNRSQTSSPSFLLSNDTAAAVNYTVTVTANTGPSYSFKDSVTGGVSYNWEDISTTGTRLETISEADDSSEEVALTQFSFPYFGSNYSSVWVSSNGYVALTGYSSTYNNTQLPNVGAPPAMIAPFWKDLNPYSAGDIYVKEESNRLIIQWQGVAPFSGSGTYTFQMVMHDDGALDLRYQSMTGNTGDCTVGLQDTTGYLGAQVVYNSPYVTDGLAIHMSPVAEFFTIASTSGAVPANSVEPLAATFKSWFLPFGTHSANVSVTHDGAGASPLSLNAALTVLNRQSTVSLVSPIDGANILESETFAVSAQASDADSVIDRVEFYLDGVEAAEVSYSYGGVYSTYLPMPTAGVHILTAKVIDVFGEEVETAPVSVTIVPDTDFDGLPDAWEIAYGLDPNVANPLDADADEDGATDRQEYLAGSNPVVGDSDADGLLDGYEIRWGLDPMVSVDSDSDGLPDDFETAFGMNPQSAVDTDGDGLPDDYETAFGFNPAVSEAHDELDADDDGLSNLLEYQAKSLPREFDSDGDLLPDGAEALAAPYFSVTGYDDPSVDFDSDGLINLDEIVYNTLLTNPDTDGDGVLDGAEVAQGSNPGFPGDGGEAPDPETVTRVSLSVGDHSGSHSERYNMILKPVEGQGRTIVHQAPVFGEVSTREYTLDKGVKYEVTIRHTGTNLPDGPDYDYTAEIDPTGGEVEYKVEDDEGILGVHDESDPFFAEGKKAYVIVPKVELDTLAVTGVGSVPVSTSGTTATLSGQGSFFGMVRVLPSSVLANEYVEIKFVQNVKWWQELDYASPQPGMTKLLLTTGGGWYYDGEGVQNVVNAGNLLRGDWIDPPSVTNPDASMWTSFSVNAEFRVYLRYRLILSVNNGWHTIGRAVWTFQGSAAESGGTWQGSATSSSGAGTESSEEPLLTPLFPADAEVYDQ